MRTSGSRKINSLRIFGTAPGKGPILSFTMEGAHAHDIATMIDRAGVAVRAGTHCAMPLLQRFGVTSTCRASFALYNTLRRSRRAGGCARSRARAVRLRIDLDDRQPDPGARRPPSTAVRRRKLDALTEAIIAALKTVYDPEIPADIYELGLIYNVDVDDDRFVTIDMTLTAPGVRSRAKCRAGWRTPSALFRRCRRQGQHGVRPAVGSEPDVGRGAGRAGYVVRL